MTISTAHKGQTINETNHSKTRFVFFQDSGLLRPSTANESNLKNGLAKNHNKSNSIFFLSSQIQYTKEAILAFSSMIVMDDSSVNQKRVKLRDGRFLAYREGGVPKKEAKYKIILVHGFGSSKTTNFHVSKEVLKELGVYFLSYDRSGYGESDSNTRRSLISEVNDIEELVDQLEIGPKFYVIGRSMGAYPVWGCLRHIPHRLSGVAFVAPVVNYQWQSLPEKLIKKDYRRVIIKWNLWISEHAHGLLHYWVIQKLFLRTFLLLRSVVSYFDSHDMEVVKRRTGSPMVTTKDRLFNTLREDFVACYEKWDFEPANLSISEESSVHIWQGNKDLVIPVQLQRCILEKQPLINYHEVPNGGHMIAGNNAICDAVLRSLLLGEEQNKPILNKPFDENMSQDIGLFWGFKPLLLLFLIFSSLICSYFFY